MKNKKGKKIYKTVTDFKRVMKLWKMRNLTLEGKFFIITIETIF